MKTLDFVKKIFFKTNEERKRLGKLTKFSFSFLFSRNLLHGKVLGVGSGHLPVPQSRQTNKIGLKSLFKVDLMIYLVFMKMTGNFDVF